MKHLLAFFLCCFLTSNAQETFQWNAKHDKIKIPFKLVSNLIILPISINGADMNMILDTGSESSMIFSLPENDSIEFKNIKKISLKGLGESQSIAALHSEKNVLDISGYSNKNFQVLIVLDQDVNISERLGIEVNGILNGSFFNDRIIEIDYIRKKLIIHKEDGILESRRVKKFKSLPIKIIKQRPFLNLNATINKADLNLNLLVDIGLSDGLWIFEDEKIKPNDVYFEDILGRGLSGEVVGKKSRVDQITIADYKFSEALVSYPYPKFFPLFHFSADRNGSIGAGILSRFTVIFDYKNNKMYLSPNSKFSEPFNYNMSGLEIQHNGIEYLKETIPLSGTQANSGQRVDRFINGTENFLYKFSLKPIFEIASVKNNSPAFLAGILTGDKVVKINKKSIQNYSLQEINELMRSEEGKWIYIDIERNGMPIAFKFQLKKII